MDRVKVDIDIVYLAEICEKDLGYNVDTQYHKNTRYAFARTQSGRRKKHVVEQFVDGVRVGVYNAPSTIEIFD